jgi:hypothetical protein
MLNLFVSSEERYLAFFGEGSKALLAGSLDT